jgi:hypothetical protein
VIFNFGLIISFASKNANSSGVLSSFIAAKLYHIFSNVKYKPARLQKASGSILTWFISKIFFAKASFFQKSAIFCSISLFLGLF